MSSPLAKKPAHNGSGRTALYSILLLSILLLILFWVKSRLITEKEPVAPPPAFPRAAPPSMTEEEARAATQRLVDERMSDPVYLKQLEELTTRRRALAIEAHDLLEEITLWQQEIASTNATLAAHLQQLQALQLANTNNSAEIVAVIEQEQAAIQAIMQRDPQGAQLEARQADIQARRDQLQQDAEATVRNRMQQQIQAEEAEWRAAAAEAVRKAAGSAGEKP